MATTILLYNRRNWRNERFPADFATWSLVNNPPDGPKNANTNKTFSSIRLHEHVFYGLWGNQRYGHGL